MAERKILEPDLGFINEVTGMGGEDLKKCFQCATCSAVCTIAPEENPFPRKEMIWAKWGLKDRLRKDLDIWLCYYCGDCSRLCPCLSHPGELMMALRRWAIAQYDWTGLSRRMYTSRIWEIGTVLFVALLVVGLFWWSGAFTEARMPVDRVSVNTFIPVDWVHYADWTLAAILTFLLLSNTARMWHFTMRGQKIPFSIYRSELKTFFLHALTQKRWRDCGDHNFRWLKHLMLVFAYSAMFALVMFFLNWLQVDGPEFTAVSWLGYIITFILLYVSGEAIISRIRKKEEIHKHSHDSDWMFLILLFLTALTGILMHVFRRMDLPLSTYYMYVIHLAIAVPMLVVEVPFMKWAHLLYRPLAMYLKAVKEKAGEVQVTTSP